MEEVDIVSNRTKKEIKAGQKEASKIIKKIEEEELGKQTEDEEPVEEIAEKGKIKIFIDVLRYGKKPYKTGSLFTEEVLKTSKVSVVDMAMQQVAYDIKLYLGLIKSPKRK